MLPEEKLIERCGGKDPAAMEELYRKYSQKMYGVCMRYAKNRMDAQDLLHDGFMKVFSGIGEYKGNGSFEGWVRRIMVNTAINFYRKKSVRFAVSDDEEKVQIEAHEVDAVSQMSTKELMDRINELPDGYRMVFNMYVLEGFQHNEIADLLGISESTSKTQLLKARKYLMRTVKKEAYEKVYG